MFAVTLGIASPDVVFSGFSSPALWLILSGLILGVAIRRTGLGDRLSRSFLAHAPANYIGIVTVLVLAGTLLSFIMPSSMGRVVMMVPVAILIADQLGMASDGRSRAVLITTVALGAYLPSSGILPANIPNLILAGGAYVLYGISFRYVDYFVATFPTIGLGKLAIIIAVGALLSSAAVSKRPALQPPTPMSGDERKVAIALTIALALWMTDSVHGINPAWVGLAAAILCLLPVMGVLDERAFNHDIAWVAVIHTAGIISLGAVVAASGFGAWLGRLLADIAPFTAGHDFWNFSVLVVLMTLIGLMTTTPGLPAVVTPLAGTLAEASGLPLRAVLLAQVLAFSTIIFPYQGAPLVFSFYAGGVPLRVATMVLVAVSVASLIVITPLTYIWWRTIGILP